MHEIIHGAVISVREPDPLFGREGENKPKPILSLNKWVYRVQRGNPEFLYPGILIIVREFSLIELGVR